MVIISNNRKDRHIVATFSYNKEQYGIKGIVKSTSSSTEAQYRACDFIKKNLGITGFYTYANIKCIINETLSSDKLHIRRMYGGELILIKLSNSEEVEKFIKLHSGKSDNVECEFSNV